MPQYSLQQRFQGALLGSTIGQRQIGPPHRTQTSHWVDIPPINPPNQIHQCIQWLCQPQQHPAPTLSENPAQAALDLLPLWLYGHESWRQRQAWLHQIPDWHSRHPDQSLLWLYGEAIAQALRPDSQPQTLIHHLRQRWQQHARSGAPKCNHTIQQQLDQIQQWQQQPTTIASIKATFTDQSTPALATTMMSLFCFVSTPHNLPLAQCRAQQLQSGPSDILGGLLGGLIGAYGGWHQLPTHQIAPLLGSKSPSDTSIDRIQGNASEFSIVPFTQLSQQLIQAWAGTITASATITVSATMPNPTQTISPTPTVTAPR